MVYHAIVNLGTILISGIVFHCVTYSAWAVLYTCCRMDGLNNKNIFLEYKSSNLRCCLSIWWESSLWFKIHPSFLYSQKGKGRKKMGGREGDKRGQGERRGERGGETDVSSYKNTRFMRLPFLWFNKLLKILVGKSNQYCFFSYHKVYIWSPYNKRQIKRRKTLKLISSNFYLI